MHFEFPPDATPIPNASDLLIPWVQSTSDLNRVEAENISHAQRKYLRASSQDISSWFHPKEFLAAHRFMFEKVWAWAGRWRKQITSIGVNPSLIPLKMAELCEEVCSWSTEPVELSFLEKAARIHHRLVDIHPFENGNGRFSRLIADRWLLTWKCQHPIWPDSLHQKSAARMRYIQALQDADRGNYELLITFMKDSGAVDPNLSTLLQDKYYRFCMEGTRGIAKARALLRNGENPNAITSNGHRSLQLILKAKLDPQTRLTILKLWVERGAEVDVSDKSGLTPFQVAVAIRDKECALFLRSKGGRAIAPPGIGYANYYAMFEELLLK